MERLTRRRADTGEPCICTIEGLNNAVERLAAYEDTGLEPEEIKELCTDDVAKIAKLFRHMIEDGSIDHLQELLEAEKDGRMVVSSFKPGECVYVLERDEDGEPIDVAGCMFLAEASGYVIASAFVNDMEGAEETLSYHAEETKDNYDTDLMVCPIEDVYQTLQEAEAARREEADNG